MKLKVTDWKHAWFESHISDRFFQEMSKLEKGAVQGLDMTAQWMEQIMIEVGLLAQAMIRLEHDGAPEPQIKLAYDKALRLAALAMHLITALDGADRAQLRSASIVRSEPAEWVAPRSPLAPAGAPPAAAAPPAALPPAALPVRTAAPAIAAAPAAAPLPARQPAATALNQGARLAQMPAHERQGAAHAERPAPEPAPAPAPDGLQFASLLEVSGRNTPRSESHLRQTIVSLYQQGLSRAEIEMVTGEPRHVVEAVLNHARNQPKAGTQAP
jgi:hypothetical protein